MPKIVDRKNMQNKILDAALRVFAMRGYYTATIEDIATEADLGKGTLYLYFKNKDAIAEGVVIRHFDGIAAALEAMPPPEDVDTLVKSLDHVMEIPEDTVQFMRVFFEVFGPSFASERFTKTIAAAFDDLAAIYESHLRHLQEVGAIRSGLDPAATARMLAGSLDGMILHRSLFALPDARYHAMRQTFLDVFRKGLTSADRK